MERFSGPQQSTQEKEHSHSKEKVERNWDVATVETNILEAAHAYPYIEANAPDSPLLKKARQDIEEALIIAFMNGRTDENLREAAVDHAQMRFMHDFVANYFVLGLPSIDQIRWSLMFAENRDSQFTR